MEDENKNDPRVVDTVDQTQPTETVEGYVSPEVEAAISGEQVDFGKHFASEDEDDSTND